MRFRGLMFWKWAMSGAYVLLASMKKIVNERRVDTRGDERSYV